ncbi:MAG TPA: VWA domain-containing protein [Bryobacteraceae bacterium]|jgi:Ca-activated chloride channel family protein|nr:VWA domain-containing protein [Bryobacteraceae bacterium]
MILVVIPGFAQSQPAPAPSGLDAGPYRIAVDVDLVVLPTTVRDRHGLSVLDLRANDFAVYEDGVAQRIKLFLHEDIPVVAGLLVDHSSSMRAKLTDVTSGARAFVHSSNPDDQMFVVNFNETVSLGLPAAIGFTTSAEELERAIWRTEAGGETALYDAILLALTRLQASGRDKKVLVVISDGGDNASAHKLAEVLQMAERSSAIIYAVGLFEPDDTDANPRVLNRLAQATGGEAFFPEQLGEVVTICERIARDIRSQYTIGYFSSGAKREGAYRAVRVSAHAPDHGKLVVRTRQGYIAGASRHKDDDDK